MTVIEDTPDRLVLEQSPWPTGWFVGFGTLACFLLAATVLGGAAAGFAVLIGLFLSYIGLFEIGWTRLTLDRPELQVTLETRSLLKGGREYRALGLVSRAEVLVRKSQDRSSSLDDDRPFRGRTVTFSHSAALRLTDDSTLTFARPGSAAAAGTLVDRVNAWLDAAR